MKNNRANKRRARIPYGRVVMDKKTKAETRSSRKAITRKEVKMYMTS